LSYALLVICLVVVGGLLRLLSDELGDDQIEKLFGLIVGAFGQLRV
jgi:hypothetical protein